MELRRQTLDLNKYTRTIVTSDLHGDYDGFINMLKKCDFHQDDVLIIVGDILEKGTQSLKLLQTIIQLSKTYAIFPLLGNNDTFFEEWNHHLYNEQQLLGYLKSHHHSIFHEMASQLSIDIIDDQSVKYLMQQIYLTYAEEIEYLCSLPHIIETSSYLFVHAGLSKEALKNHDIDTCLTWKEFGYETNEFNKTMIVGHWPASNYCRDIICVNPYFHPNNMISIDGGNSMKSWEQINYLIIQNDKITYDYYDSLPKVQLLDDQNENKDYFSVQFPNTKIEIISSSDDRTLCKVLSLDKMIEVKTNQIYSYKGNTYMADLTTYKMKLQKNDIVSLCKYYDDRILIKKDGIISIYKGRFRLINETKGA